jgi:predicted GTPase
MVVYLFDVNEIEAAELKTLAEELKQQNNNYILAGNKADLED